MTGGCMRAALRLLLCFLAVATGVGALGPQPVRATALCVNPNGSNGCFSKIGDAVAAASAGDTITVAAGTYIESQIAIAKSVTIIGAGRLATTLAAGNYGNGTISILSGAI